MKNPFEDIISDRAKEEDFEDIGGAMECQTCREVVTEGKYFTNLKLLTWQCSQEHISRIEDIDL